MTSLISTGNSSRATISQLATGRLGPIEGFAVVIQQRTSGNVVSGNAIAGSGQLIVISDSVAYENTIIGNSFDRLGSLALDIFPQQGQRQRLLSRRHQPSLATRFRSVTRSRVRGSAPAGSTVQIYTSLKGPATLARPRLPEDGHRDVDGGFAARVDLRRGRWVTAGRSRGT